jgi:Ser/Thr protein kinase RdoA (MazF antagonist)
VPARDGRTVVTAGGAPLALLTWVPGEPLDAGDQTLIGATLAAVHHGLESFDLPAARRFHWIDADAPHLGVRPWVRPAVAAAVRAYARLGPLTWGLLHTDPAPDAFRYDRETGVCGVIDWSVGLSGPLLYDLASAAMYVGGLDPAGRLIDAYLRAGPLTADEVRRGLATMLRFRLAVQADYFARRIVADDLTGVESPADNDKGLSHAQRHLA